MLIARIARSARASASAFVLAVIVLLLASSGVADPRGTTLIVENAPGKASAEKAEEEEAFKTGVDAYIFGYPLVTMEITRRVMTNAKEPQGNHAPMGQFANEAKYPDASFREVTAPNVDTLYSVAWLDLSKEPYVLHVPEEPNRYYLMPMLDGFTNVIASPGTRTTGTSAGDFAITGPNYKGTLPNGMKELRSPTNLVWIIGRTYANGTPADYDVVHAIQAKYSLTPLNFYGKTYTPPAGKVDPNVDMKTPPREQVNRMTAQEYFALLASLMKKNAPSPADLPMVERLAKIGVAPGGDFNPARLSPAVMKGLERAPKTAQETMVASETKVGTLVNGWLMPKDTGQYGTDYLTRAVVAMFGLGANLPEDAIYAVAKVDADGQPLSGANRYVLHFDKKDIPPVKGFWSLTAYDDQYFLVKNPHHKYAVSPRDELKLNDDGSLDLYLTHDSPGADKEANWLPTPRDEPFTLMLRLYWPEQSVISGQWRPQPVKRL
jgi:DNA sulfur modification protein DndE